MENSLTIAERFMKDWKVYVGAFAILIVSDFIGEFQVSIGPGLLLIFPIFYGIIFGVLLGPDLLNVFSKREVEAASPLVLVAIAPFIVKLGIIAGEGVSTLASLGPALILQEFGNIVTVIIAVPLALLLGFKREAIGAGHSINRESNLALISNIYGPDSAEMRGTLSVYIIGGLVGTIYFGFLATIVASTGLFHPYALGMASGVGAGIMMASATSSLAHMYPAFADDILMLGGASDTLTGLTGVYAALFIALPLANKIYDILEPRIGRKKSKEQNKEIVNEEEEKVQ